MNTELFIISVLIKDIIILQSRLEEEIRKSYTPPFAPRVPRNPYAYPPYFPVRPPGFGGDFDHDLFPGFPDLRSPFG